MAHAKTACGETGLDIPGAASVGQSAPGRRLSVPGEPAEFEALESLQDDASLNIQDEYH